MGEIYVYVDNSRMGIVGTNIKELRKAIGYSSVFKFATAVGLPEKRVDAWERGNGNPKVDDAIMLAKFFKIDLELLREKELTENQVKTIAEKLKKNKQNSPNLNGNDPYNLPGGKNQMNDLILMSIEALFKLQELQEDLQMVKAIQQVIAYKQYAEGLERENKLLKEMIDILKTKKP